MRVRVIGVGTRRGDDAAGLWVAEALSREALPEGVEVALCERPDAALLDVLDGAEAVVLVDAVRSGAAPGALLFPQAAALRREARVSSHGMGVPEALALAEALGRAPRRLAIVGIEVGKPGQGAPSPAVRRGVREAGARVRALLAEWTAAPAERG